MSTLPPVAVLMHAVEPRPSISEKSAKSSFEPSSVTVPEKLRSLDVPTYQEIKYRDEEALWRDDHSRFRVVFRHLGSYYNKPIKINVVDQGHVAEVGFSKDLFEYGADGFSANLNDDQCHRPEVVQDLIGVPWGDKLTAADVARLLTHPRGLLSKIPGDTEVAVCVNKAPIGAEGSAQEFAQEVLRRCGRRIHRVAVGDNRQGGLVSAYLAETD